jgi:hypothetical protein
VTGTPDGEANGPWPVTVAQTKQLPGNSVDGFPPGDLDEAVSLAFERGGQAVRAVVMAPLVETLVADVTSGVKVVLVAAYLYDSSVLVQGHDEAAVAATEEAGRNLLLHEMSPA